MRVKIVILITRWNHNLNYDCITRRSCYKYQFCCDKYVFVTTNTWHVFVTTNIFVVTKVRLSWQNCDCHDKIFWSYFGHICRDKTRLLLRQNYHVSVLLQQNFCHDKTVTTNVLSWQAYFCHTKRRVLSQQKLHFEAAPTKDSNGF